MNNEMQIGVYDVLRAKGRIRRIIRRQVSVFFLKDGYKVKRNNVISYLFISVILFSLR